MGFHTDEIAINQSLASPRYVSIYNLFLGYKGTANFHWIPFERWEDFKLWQGKLIDKKFNLEITPISYKKADDQLAVTGSGVFEVSIIQKINKVQARRLFIINNWFGAHARDIFKEPIGMLKYTRSFFRMMSKEALAV